MLISFCSWSYVINVANTTKSDYIYSEVSIVHVTSTHTGNVCTLLYKVHHNILNIMKLTSIYSIMLTSRSHWSLHNYHITITRTRNESGLRTHAYTCRDTAHNESISQHGLYIFSNCFSWNLFLSRNPMNKITAQNHGWDVTSM